MKSEADRYLHYFNRYFLHETAGKSVPQLRLKALEKQQQYRELTSGNPDFLIEAVDLLAKVQSHTTHAHDTHDTRDTRTRHTRHTRHTHTTHANRLRVGRVCSVVIF